MAQRHRLEVAYLLGSLLLLALFLHPSTAYSAPGDPPSGSPAGAVYQLPLEQGRSDAAPKGSGGTGAAAVPGGKSGSAAGPSDGAAEPEESGSLYRTENNFGSSSRVPGVAAATAGAGGLAAGAGGDEASGGDRAGGGANIAGAVAAETAGTGNTSVTASAVLLGAIVLLAAAIGLLSRRFRAR